MTSPTKPQGQREWWLGQRQVDTFDRDFRQAFEIPNHPDAQEIHVIEYAAYDAVCAELDQLKAEAERLRADKINSPRNY